MTCRGRPYTGCMRLSILGSLLVGVVLASPAGAADVRVTLSNGRVSVSATDATVSQILSEWARVGQTRVINAERLPQTPVSIELTDVPEAQALDTLLRSASGYLAAPRAASVPNASAYDRIFVLASSSGAAARTSSTAPPPPQAAFAPPAFQPPVDDEPEPEPEMPRQVPGLPGIGAGGAPLRSATPFGQQPQLDPQQAPAAQPFPAPVPFGAPSGGATTSGATGVSRPGMVVPTPQQPPGQARPNTPEPR